MKRFSEVHFTKYFGSGYFFSIPSEVRQRVEVELRLGVEVAIVPDRSQPAPGFRRQMQRGGESISLVWVDLFNNAEVDEFFPRLPTFNSFWAAG